MAMPRLNNFGVWRLLGAIGLGTMSLCAGGTGTGWTFYPPLSNLAGHPRYAMDFLIFSLHTAGASSLGARINFIVTFFAGRPYGVSLDRLPVFV